MSSGGNGVASGDRGVEANLQEDEVGLLALIGRSISWHFDGGSTEGAAGSNQGSRGDASQLLQMAKSNTMSGFRSIGSTVRQLHRPQCVSASSSEAAGTASGPQCHVDGKLADSWITPKKYAPTNLMRFRALGQLNPSIYLSEGADELYEQPVGHSGRIWFVLNYNRDSQQLAVTVAKARNLRPVGLGSGSAGSAGRGQSSPMTATCESPSREASGEFTRRQLSGRQTVRTLMRNFAFSLIPHYQIPPDRLDSHSVQLTVCQIDRQRRHRPLGYADFALGDLLSFGKDCRIFRDLEPAEFDAADRTEVRISLTHHALMQRITVGLHECRNLPVREDDQPMELYLRVSLHSGMQGREIKSKRTEAVSTGVFNESLIFNRFTDAKQSTIRLLLMRRCSSIGALFDRPLGSVVLGPELFTKGRELEHWQEMCDNPEQSIVHWHTFSSDC